MKTYLPGRERQGLPLRPNEKGVYGVIHRLYCGPRKRSFVSPARSRKHRSR